MLTLGIGIGTNSTVFSWIEATLLNPLPGASDPQKVVALEFTPSGEWVPTSYLDFRDFRDNSKLIESMSVADSVALAVGNNPYVEHGWAKWSRETSSMCSRYGLNSADFSIVPKATTRRMRLPSS